MRLNWFWMGLFGAFLGWLAFGAGEAHSAELEEDRAVRAIIGEAEGEGPRGMYLVACALRNRGTFRGVYGDRAVTWSGNGLMRRHGQESLVIQPIIYHQAMKAWHESAYGEDLTLGATIWQSQEDMQSSGMDFDKLDCTIIHGGHYFFKELQSVRQPKGGR